MTIHSVTETLLLSINCDLKGEYLTPVAVRPLGQVQEGTLTLPCTHSVFSYMSKHFLL